MEQTKMLNQLMAGLLLLAAGLIEPSSGAKPMQALMKTFSIIFIGVVLYLMYKIIVALKEE